MSANVAHVNEPNEKAAPGMEGSEYWLVTDSENPEVKMRFPDEDGARNYAGRIDRKHWYTR